MSQKILMLNRKIALQSEIPDWLHVGTNIWSDMSGFGWNGKTIQGYAYDHLQDEWYVVKDRETFSLDSIIVLPSSYDSQLTMDNMSAQGVYRAARLYYDGRAYYIAGKIGYLNNLPNEYFVSEPFVTTKNTSSIKVAVCSEYIGGKVQEIRTCKLAKESDDNYYVLIPENNQGQNQSDRSNSTVCPVEMSSLSDYPEAYKHLFETGGVTRSAIYRFPVEEVA